MNVKNPTKTSRIGRSKTTRPAKATTEMSSTNYPMTRNCTFTTYFPAESMICQESFENEEEDSIGESFDEDESEIYEQSCYLNKPIGKTAAGVLPTSSKDFKASMSYIKITY